MRRYADGICRYVWTETVVASEIAVGDLVQATGHAGPWIVVDISKGMASLQHSDGHRLSVRTTTLSVVRKAAAPHPGAQARPRSTGRESDPTLFDSYDNEGDHGP